MGRSDPAGALTHEEEIADRIAQAALQTAFDQMRATQIDMVEVLLALHKKTSHLLDVAATDERYTDKVRQVLREI